jgi:hypothetical protein
MRSVQPSAGLWQVAQLITPEAEMRGSKNSIRPSSIRSATWWCRRDRRQGRQRLKDLKVVRIHFLGDGRGANGQADGCHRRQQGGKSADHCPLLPLPKSPDHRTQRHDVIPTLYRRDTDVGRT